MYFPSKKSFLKLASRGNVIPVYREIFADMETPVSAYLKLAQGTQYSFLLESVEGEEKVARFSFLARNPELVLEVRGKKATITRFSGRSKTIKEHPTEAPLTTIRQIMAGYKLVETPGLPRFCGGLVGYIGYDVVRFFEKLPNPPTDDLKIPDILLVLSKNLVIFDHVNHKIKVVACAVFNPRDSRQKKLKSHQKAIQEINALIEDLKKPLKRIDSHGRRNGLPAFRPQSNVSKVKFIEMVKKAKQKIRAGDIIQVVLSQRFKVPLKTAAFDVYRSLRSLNPSPYMYYLDFEDIKIIGSSPELLVRCEDGVAETRPIAGTRRRGQDEKEDSTLAKNLLNDPKEKAEHIMLVDLGRNDLGRVCRQGSVKISEFMAIEKYSHVMHIVSNVKGELRKDKDSLHLLEAAFPAGTVSGAPKIRAMEIIDELENRKRGPYAGCIGYFSFSGNLDTCITIRTIISVNGQAYIQAGAGIVADSNPAKEYQETLNKAKAQILAIQMAYNQIT